MRAELQTGDRRLDAGSAGLHDHGHVAVDRAHLTEKLDPGYARVEDVGHDERRSPDLEDFQTLVAVAGEPAGIARRLEDLAQDEAYSTIVIDDQDVAMRHAQPTSPAPRRSTIS